MSIFDDDIVRDILRRVIDAAAREGSFTDALADQIEKQVRADWAGTEPYIRHGVEEQRADRNEKINDLYWNQGQKDIPRLAQRHGLSTKQIRRIVGI